MIFIDSQEVTKSLEGYGQKPENNRFVDMYKVRMRECT